MKWFLALAMVLLGSGCTITVGQRNFLPVRATPPLPPMAEGATRKNIELVVDGGVTLRGWHLQRQGAQNVVLFFHGNGAGIMSSDWALHWLSSALNADVVALDHRGYGFSDGQASVDAIVTDSLSIRRFLGGLGLDGRPLIVVGQSMGTAPAIHLAAAKPVAALILISPFSSYEDVVSVVRRQAPWYAHVVVDESLTGLTTSPLADLPKVTSPTLIIHGTRDELSTDDVVQRVEAACAAPKKEVCRFVGTHNDANPTTPDVRTCMQRFLAARLAP
jgi:pimeloyl-ACP methyl ester carboxylesterase